MYSMLIQVKKRREKKKEKQSRNKGRNERMI